MLYLTRKKNKSIILQDKNSGDQAEIKVIDIYEIDGAFEVKLGIGADKEKVDIHRKEKITLIQKKRETENAD